MQNPWTCSASGIRKAVSNRRSIWEPKPKMGLQHNTYSLQQSTHTENLFLGIRRGITQIWVSSLLETYLQLQRVLSFRSCWYGTFYL